MFRYELADLGSRAAAWIIDSIVQIVILASGALALQAALGDGSGFEDLGRIETGKGMAIAFYLILLFLVKWGYFAVFESLLSGQSPGKRAMGVQVVAAGGEALDFPAIAVRNLVRVVDDFPGLPLLGGLVSLTNPKGQRLGDLAASTIVVKARRGKLVAPAEARIAADGPSASLSEASARLTEAELGVLRKFLNERAKLPPAMESKLAARLAAQAEEKTGLRRGGSGDLEYLESVYRAHAVPRDAAKGGRR